MPGTGEQAIRSLKRHWKSHDHGEQHCVRQAAPQQGCERCPTSTIEVAQPFVGQRHVAFFELGEAFTAVTVIKNPALAMEHTAGGQKKNTETVPISRDMLRSDEIFASSTVIIQNCCGMFPVVRDLRKTGSRPR